MTKRPLFSTYRQGENRVTAAMLAVFERLDLGTLEQILAGASGESSLQLVGFDVVQPEGIGTVPDGRIQASFKYLFEVKTEYDALLGKQLRGHLDHLEEGQFEDCRLYAVTPDLEEPAVIAAIGDDRLRWLGFKQIDDAIHTVLEDDQVPADEAFLLRELRVLFGEEGLLGREDTVIVAAASAYDFYRHYAAYVCQPGRSFRRGISYLGFYRAKQIKREIPLILARRDGVEFTPANAAALRVTGRQHDQAIAELIERSIAGGDRVEGLVYQVFLLTPPDDARTRTLGAPIVHGGPAAWTMGQRYAFLDGLLQAGTTDDL